MDKFLQLALWNTNGLIQHTETLKTFISIHIMLILEMHFTEKSYLKLHNYAAYNMNHVARTARGGTAIIIKNAIKHHQLN
jgi:hypothetical protein